MSQIFKINKWGESSDAPVVVRKIRRWWWDPAITIQRKLLITAFSNDSSLGLEPWSKPRARDLVNHLTILRLHGFPFFLFLIVILLFWHKVIFDEI